MTNLKPGEVYCCDCHNPTKETAAISVGQRDGLNYLFCSWDCAANFCAFMAPSFFPNNPCGNTGVILDKNGVK